jgi:hypothetical protein
MDRLISADALLRRMRKDPLFSLVEQYGISGVIDAEPTVDAIPVAWLKKYAEEHHSCLQEFRYMLVDWTMEKEE